ncbi:MAG: helix-turn-helix domain-containing protein [Puniceicoccaceae bacterium]|nr:MAG: helix-turn-helix domain-containing protein [Puniceicoccaceae bacterium]
MENEPDPPFDSFRFGHFRQEARYHTERPRGSGDYLFILTLRGTGRIEFRGQARDISEGEVLLYAPGARQSYRTAPGAGHWELVWAHFQPRPHWSALLHWPQWQPGIGLVALPATDLRRQVRQAALEMVAEARRPWASARSFALNRLEECLLRVDLVARGDRSLRLDPRVRRVIDHLAQNLSRPFSLAELARAGGLSAPRLSHLFREQVGQSPQRFAEQMRMAQAGLLLRDTTLTIAQVADQCGYGDPLYFSRRFRRRMKESPSRFRRRLAGGFQGDQPEARSGSRSGSFRASDR